MRLPQLSAPVVRSAAPDPWRPQVAAARLGCDACLAACRRLPGRLGSVCESLCNLVCRQR
jgi:hypothetical protein